MTESLADNYSPLTREAWMENMLRYHRKRKRRVQHTNWRRRMTTIHGMETLVVNSSTNSRGEETHVNNARFDTDSGRIGVDNRASACISDYIGDFIGPLTKVHRAIKGFGGERVLDVYKGTICWKWNDNDGNLHRFVIPNSYYVPKGKCRLLSPQHWAKTHLSRHGRRANAMERQGIGETTTVDGCKLFWNNRRNELDMEMGQDNVATFNLAPGFRKFDLFCKECKVDYDRSQEEHL